jgi:hypothetical protein
VIFIGFFGFFCLYVRYLFNTATSDSTVSEDAGIEPRTVATTALTVRRSNYSARSHPQLNINYSENSTWSLQYVPVIGTNN